MSAKIALQRYFSSSLLSSLLRVCSRETELIKLKQTFIEDVLTKEMKTNLKKITTGMGPLNFLSPLSK
jgi:hypothetical protein